MTRFELILNCKIDAIQKIIEYAGREIKENFIIITDSDSLRDEFNNQGINAETIDDNIINGGTEDEEIFKTVSESIKSLRNTFSEVKYDGIEVFNVFSSTIHDSLIYLQRFYSILYSKRYCNVFLCFENWNSYYLACLSMASLLGYKTSLPLAILKNDLVTKDPLYFIKHKHIFEILYYNRLPKYKRSRNYKEKVNQILGFMKKISISNKSASKFVEKYNLETFLKHDKKNSKKMLKKLSILQIQKRPCLLLVNTNNFDLYLKPVYPLIEEFEKKQYPYLILTNDIRAKNALSDKKIGHIDYDPFLKDFEYNFDVLKQIINIMKEIATHNNSVVSSLFQFLLNDDFLFQLINHMRMIELFSTLISKLNPISIFVMPDGIDDQMLMVDVAKKYKIKNITTLANIVAPSPRSVPRLSAEIIATYGEDCNVSLTKMGYSKDRLIMTGFPRWDIIKKLNASVIQSNLRKKLDINFELPIIFIATSSWDDNEINWMIDAIKFANEKKYEVIIKFHPDFELVRSKVFLDRAKSLKFHLGGKDTDVTELLSVSTITITDFSSVGMATILFDKPLIVVNMTGKSFPNNRFDEYGVALLAKTTKELESCIDKLMNDIQTLDTLKESRKKYQYWYNYKNDGKAAFRLFDILTSQS